MSQSTKSPQKKHLSNVCLLWQKIQQRKSKQFFQKVALINFLNLFITPVNADVGLKDIFSTKNVRMFDILPTPQPTRLFA